MDENQIPEPNQPQTLPKTSLKEQFTTVTPVSKFLAMILFIALPFIGFWFGLQFKKTDNIKYEKNIENLTPIDTQANPAESQTPITTPSSEKTLNNENVSEGYRIVSPKAGDTFYEDEPITITWQPFDPTKYLNISFIPDICTSISCDEVYDEILKSKPYYTLIPFLPTIDLEKEHFRDVNGTYTLFLPKLSGNTQYPKGKYRIILSSGPLSRNTFLAVSDSFNLTDPKDRSSIHTVGEKIGDFMITNISPYGMATVGTTTIHGFYFENEMLGMPCFDVINEDAPKIPKSATDPRSPWFCFDNDVPDELRNSVGTTTIQIANYRVDFRPMETADGADFVSIIH